MSQSTALDAVRQFIEQRPGFHFCDYGGDSASYRADYKRALRDLHDARALLRYCETRPIDVTASESAWSWYRLTLTQVEGGYRVDYCTGQFFPIEYRGAACGLLSSAIWAWLRDACGCETLEAIESAAKRELGAAIARRWFRWG